jgi:hypothetical protein
MRSSTTSEPLALAQPSEHASLDAAPVTVVGQVAQEEISQPDHRRAARGVLIGILLGAGAWGAIWVVVSALWRRG